GPLRRVDDLDPRVVEGGVRRVELGPERADIGDGALGRRVNDGHPGAEIRTVPDEVVGGRLGQDEGVPPDEVGGSDPRGVVEVGQRVKAGPRVRRVVVVRRRAEQVIRREGKPVVAVGPVYQVARAGRGEQGRRELAGRGLDRGRGGCGRRRGGARLQVNL